MGIRSLFNRLRRWESPPDPKALEHFVCPICQRPLVGRPQHGFIGGPLGGFYLEATREELVAKCPVHGHPPFNQGRMWER